MIELNGADAEKFAQAQFCNDVSGLAPGASQLSAWLNPQGRVRRMFHLLRAGEERYLLLLRGGTAAPVIAPLRMFVLRLKVQVAALDGWRWHELAPDEDAGESWALPLPGGTRRLLLQSPQAAAPGRIGAQETAARDIDAGLPWLPEAALEQALPSWLEFARLGAISHAKGCYPGQEIVARLHFRGGGDKRVLAVVEGTVEPGPDGLLRDPAGAEAGLLLQRVSRSDGGWRALAVVKREHAAPGSTLSTENGQACQVAAAPWQRAAEQ
nr:folate-binding protein [Tahibacter harae]